jgi:hypothetical protein
VKLSFFINLQNGNDTAKPPNGPGAERPALARLMSRRRLMPGRSSGLLAVTTAT